MNHPKPLSQFTELLEAGCLLCGVEPTNIVIEGPDVIVPQPCGHVHDAKDWLDKNYRAFLPTD